MMIGRCVPIYCALLGTMFICLNAGAMTFGDAPSPGMSDSFLMELGRNGAADLLLLRLKQDEFSKDHPGIIDRLDRLLELSPNPRIPQAFDEFLERQFLKGTFNDHPELLLCTTLKRLGAHGGDAGVELLSKYIRPTSPIFRARVSDRNRGWLLGCAVLGLGLSGLPRAEAVLKEMEERPGEFVSSNLVKGDWAAARAVFAKVRQHGVSSAFKNFNPNPFIKIGN